VNATGKKSSLDARSMPTRKRVIHLVSLPVTKPLLSEVSTKRFTSFNACGPLAMASPCQSLRRWMSMSRSPHKSRERIVTLAPPHFCEAKPLPSYGPMSLSQNCTRPRKASGGRAKSPKPRLPTWLVAPQGRFEIFYEPAKSAFKGGGVLRRLRQAPFAHFRSEIELATREA